MKLFTRKIVIVLLIVLLFLLGYRRKDFFTSFDHFFHTFFSINYSPNQEKYPTQAMAIFQAVTRSSYWLASLLYTLLYAGLAAMMVYCFYLSKKSAVITFGLYMLGAFGCLLLILFGNLLNSYELGYGLAQHLKHLLQSPLFIALILAWMRFQDKFSST